MQQIDYYHGNPLVKRAGIHLTFTKEEVDEYIKCAHDAKYFIENYVKIINVDKGLVSFKLYDFQAQMIDTFVDNRFTICKLPRQSGKSTTVVGYILWNILFTDNQNCAILANKGQLARDLLAKVQLAYENIPKWLQQGVVSWNKGSIELENGSKLVAHATSSSAIRGGSYNLIFLDEFAFVPMNIAQEFFSSVYPTISSGNTTKIIIVSTPNGMNHFYKLWKDSTEGRTDYIPIQVHWRDIPGRDDKWKEQTIRNTNEQQFQQEYECEFLGSLNTLINSAKLAALPLENPRREEWGLEYYEEPQRNHTYVATVDTSHGVGMDYSVMSIIDVTDIPYKLVAKYRSNTISPLMLPDIVVRYANWYNEAYVLVETNDIGKQVAVSLHEDLEYENLLTTSMKGRAGQMLTGGFNGGTELGLRMTKQAKRIGCSNLKDIIETDKLLVCDFDLVQEFSTFISKKSSFEAEEGYHDDIVMSLVIFAWLIKQPFFRDLTNTDLRAKLAAEKFATMFDDLIPPGFHDDGQTTESLNPTAKKEDAWLWDAPEIPYRDRYN